jgi:hypothetical protein
MKWHAVFTEYGQVHECEFTAPDNYDDAARAFLAEHPKAEYWELGKPLAHIDTNLDKLDCEPSAVYGAADNG